MTPLRIKDHVRIRREIKALQDTLSMEGADYTDSFRSAVNNLEAYLDGTAIQVSWSVDDVLGQENGYETTPEDAQIILQNIEHGHDACIGISWDVIDDYIAMFYDAKTSDVE